MVSAVYEEVIVLLNQKIIIEEKLQQMKLIYAQAIYLIKRAEESHSFAYGTVFVDA